MAMIYKVIDQRHSALSRHIPGLRVEGFARVSSLPSTFQP